jgi:hypothetical protein
MDKPIEQGQYQVTIGHGTPKIGTEIKHSMYFTSAQMGEPPRTTRKQGVQARQMMKTIASKT